MGDYTLLSQQFLALIPCLAPRQKTPLSCCPGRRVQDSIEGAEIRGILQQASGAIRKDSATERETLRCPEQDRLLDVRSNT